MPTITRKIQLNFCVEDKKELKALYQKIFGWQRIVRVAANWIATHQYLMENVRDFHYYTTGMKVKLANIEKDADGILTMSRDNTTYQVLSKRFKGDCPMGMLSGLNTIISKTYKEEAKDVKLGNKTLRSYRNNIPMPVRAADISQIVKLEDGNYSFFVYGVVFKTYFGIEKSPNEEFRTSYIFEKAIKGEYKLSDSSISIKVTGKTKGDPKDQKKKEKVKIFFNAVFTFDKKELQLDKEKIADCFLSEKYPIIIKEGKGKIITIGDSEEYLHNRINIRHAMRRAQGGTRYNTKRDGRVLKTQCIDRFELAEKQYIDNRMHSYSRELVNYCLDRGIGKIILNNYQEVVDDTHHATEASNFLLSTWSYYNLVDKIKYKASVFGIEVELN